jgi:hypothetical protein
MYSLKLKLFNINLAIKYKFEVRCQNGYFWLNFNIWCYKQSKLKKKKS